MAKPNNSEEHKHKIPVAYYMTITNLCYPCCDTIGDSYHEESYDGRCKLCSLPFRVTSWKAVQNSVCEIRRSEICFYCSKLHSVCQKCGSDFGDFLHPFLTQRSSPRRRGREMSRAT